MNDNVFMQSFPYALKDGAGIEAYAKVAADELLALHRDSDMLAIFTRIDELPTEILDILARDFNVKWYLYDGTLATKRAQIKSCFYVHRHRGTVSAVSTALSDLYPSAKVTEWFEYNGRPGRFKIDLEISENGVEVEPEKIEKTLELYKRLSAALDKVVLTKRDESHIKIGFGVRYNNRYIVQAQGYIVALCDEGDALLTDEDGNVLVL